ncbi:hypothetical protein [Phaeobacter gallaeciensis]|uniref:hypothetical protein n=1 Tax=Phaeobacter gallaeciensis TaxID=60890 RepID=UPI00237FB824|nr:hypothetical protein [Phaeobacter gallaeciensis]MDE4189658.1 hypothetical protein [Phaeobacter gallaeciensis]MDE4198810.1 hypothetical protein [Phaeobacter gallaeciensis]MDE4202957.1 hypothetical protein [Phaeobacter gallaeciensis]MDE4207100.1 hypothetical protein [Phaeobacter gallaeciensis]MDE4215676.1 hypothetical protein [Phaeobacter gallaeciensis]
MKIEEGQKYVATASRALSGYMYAGAYGWVGVVLKGAEESPFPPNVVAKRLIKSRKTRADAVADAEAYLKRQQDLADRS